MSKYATRLRDHLPSLYRPEPKDEGLLPSFLLSLGLEMDTSSDQLFRVMQSHWFKFSDKATFDAHYFLDRQERGLPPVNVRNADDMLEVARYPYINDLARLASIIGIAPWREPQTHRELLENYRRRIQLYIKLYRRGLGTVEALQLITEAELPFNYDLPLAQRERSFSILENIPFINKRLPITVNGEPTELVGPLMRWPINHTGLKAVTPIIYFEGVEAVGDEIEATIDPMIERYQPGEDLVGIGLAYRGTLAANEVLKLSPAQMTWLVMDDTLYSSALPTTENIKLEPALNGPWEEVVGVPAITGKLLYQTEDKVLWLAGDDGGTPQLWRFDGATWKRVLETIGLPTINGLLQHRNELLIATDAGLLRMYLYPTSGDPFSSAEVTHFSATQIHVLENSTNGGVLVGYSDGLVNYEIDGVGDDVVSSQPLTGIDVFSICESDTELYVGNALGLFRYHPQNNSWHYYSGVDESENSNDWVSFTVDALPNNNEVYLPPITSIAITVDRSVWLGSENGLARYYARNDTGLIYKTVLEAFPDIVADAVFQLFINDDGLLLIATENGLFRYDDRDIAQYHADDGLWSSLGRADQLYPNEINSQSRAVWHFDRNLSQWQMYDYNAAVWTSFAGEYRASNSELAVQNVITLPSIVASLGSWNSGTFEASTDVPQGNFQVRCKPDETQISLGGLPAIPQILKNDSTWRYLQVEQAGLIDSTDTPWWSREGRLVPPPEREAAYPGRYRISKPALDGEYGTSMFAYCPSAKVEMEWSEGRSVSVLVRIYKRNSSEAIDPAIIDRVWQGIERVRPAAVDVRLAVEGQIVRGEKI